ncbi:MAG TPA: ATP-binding protein [Cyclobacteriaceae bacterium]|nr:ATP-binding protein [Cyclobacteriaceae bacterium]
MEAEKKLKILMLEDNPEDAFLIERVLRKDNMVFVTERVDTREEFCESIDRFQPDVVLSDHGLPRFNSREALKISLKQRATAPFILVTGTMSDEIAISCLREGADDYILKGNLSRLPSAIRRAIKERRLERLKREARYALRKQNHELVKVNSELDKFVYSVSHNLRGPLASVMGLLNIAESKAGNVEELHTMIRQSIMRLDETLKEIIDYSNNARSDVDASEINWKSLIDSAMQKLQYLPNAGDIEVTIDDSDAKFPFYSDPGRLALIFNSLYSNSILYCALDKKPKIHTKIAGAYDSLTITVTDNGIGITKNCLPSVFNMFYRATERSSGAGLGLYITKETVKKLEGEITIQSVENEGTTITITLPNNQHTV